MINYLSGKIIYKAEKFVILDVNGVGYKVFVSASTLLKIPKEEQPRKFFCYLNVKENGLDLYGFLTMGELDFFELLNDIQGIGPKAALKLSVLGPLEKIKKEILAGNEKIFEGISGIGRKRVQAIILELTGKIKEAAMVGQPRKAEESDELEDALLGLGFPKQKVKEVLKELPKDAESAEERMKEALKRLGK